MREAGTDERMKMTPGNAEIRELGTGETCLARRAMRVPFQHAGGRAGARWCPETRWRRAARYLAGQASTGRLGLSFEAPAWRAAEQQPASRLFIRGPSSRNSREGLAMGAGALMPDRAVCSAFSEGWRD
jgi:hypothetical protein